MGRDENKGMDLNWSEDFKHYILLVKIFSEGKIELQNLEIFTTGLKKLLELRRIHSAVFKHLAFNKIQEDATRN
jgi:hypothetical protein